MHCCSVLQQKLSETRLARAQVSIASSLPAASHAETVRHTCRVSLKESDAAHKGFLKSGYTAPATVSAKFREWAEAHHYALTIMTNCVVHLARAPGEKLEDTLASQRIMVFVIDPLGNNPLEDNPGTAFRITSAGFMKRSDEKFLDDIWEEAHEYRRRGMEEFRKLPKPYPPVVDPVLTCFFVNSLGITMCYQYLLYPARLDSMFAAPPSKDAHMCRTVFYDLGLLCGRMIGSLDVVLQESEDAGQVVPDVGILVRSKKGWTWKKEEWDWESRLPKRFKDGFMAPLTPRELFMYFRQILALSWYV